MDAVEESIFRRGSRVYYWSARLFPRTVQQDVRKLYSFLRVADNYVDTLPAKSRQFRELRAAWATAKGDARFDSAPDRNDSVDERVVKNIIALTRTYSFDEAWIEAFWDSMQADLDDTQYRTLEDSLWYVHGSAEVVGLMMARIMRLPLEAYEAAKLQGRAMQWINFIRDVGEDARAGRCYFPQKDLEECGLGALDETSARANQAAFTRLMQLELRRYHAWQAEARKGFRYLPHRLRPALATAVDMYDWTAAHIANDPFVVFRHQIKPSKARVLRSGLRNIVQI